MISKNITLISILVDFDTSELDISCHMFAQRFLIMHELEPTYSHDLINKIRKEISHI